MRAFYTAFHAAATGGHGSSNIPAMEAPRRVIERLLAGRMNGFDDTRYFVYQGVKVFEEGYRAEAERKEALTTEDVLHKGKK